MNPAIFRLFTVQNGIFFADLFLIWSFSCGQNVKECVAEFYKIAEQDSFSGYLYYLSTLRLPKRLACYCSYEKVCIILFQKAIFYQQKLMRCGLLEVTFNLFTVFGFFYK